MIRLMEDKDINDVLELLRQVNLVHHLGRPDIFKKATKYNHDDLLIKLHDKNSIIFVYENNNKVIGHAFCDIIKHENDNLLTDIKTLYIDDICVNESDRGKGVATQLYNYVINYAKDNNYYNVTLNVWNFNKEAMAFYNKMGMSPLKVTMEQIIK